MVEIIPKPIEEKPLWQKILFYFSILLLVGVISGYFYLFYLQKKADKDLAELNQKISEGQTPERLALEEETLDWNNKLQDFAPFLTQHILNTQFFDFLEQKTHSRIFFNKINLNSKNYSVLLSGKADSFVTLGQQLLIFEKEQLIENFTVKDVSLNKEGQIEFSLELSLSSQIFKYKY